MMGLFQAVSAFLYHRQCRETFFIQQHQMSINLFDSWDFLTLAKY